MAQRIALYNDKGGVGKSTLTTMLADGLAVYHKQRVLVIDFDCQAATSRMLIGYHGVKAAADEGKRLPDLLDTLLSPVSTRHQKEAVNEKQFIIQRASDVEEAHINGVLDIIPSGGRLFDEASRHKLAKRPSKNKAELRVLLQDSLGTYLDKLDSSYDIILMDCPAHISLYAFVAVGLANYVIVPTPLENLCLTALPELFRWLSTQFSLGAVDGFDQDYAASKGDKGGVILCGLLASHSDPLEALQFAEGLLDPRAAFVECLGEEGRFVLGV